MNILFISVVYPNPQYGGIESVTYSLATELTRRGHTCMTLYYTMEAEKCRRFDGDDLYAVRQPIHNKEPFDLEAFVKRHNVDIIVNNSVYYEHANTTLAAFRDRGNCKIISCFHNQPGYELFQIKYRLRRRAVHGAGGFFQKVLDYLRYPQYSSKRYKKSSIVRRENVEVSDRLLVLCDEFIPSYISKYRLPEEYAHKMGVMWNPLRYEYLPQQVMAYERQKEVLIVARMEEWSKKISTAIKLWHRIEKCAEYDGWRLTIVGEGEAEEYYRRLIKKLKLKRVSLEGRQDPRPYYSRASIFMMTSASEGFPMVLTEAMQNGVVPIVFDTFESLRTLISDGVDGFIIPAGDRKEYLKKLKLLMTDEELRKRMVVSGLKSVERFTAVNTADRWEQLFRSLTEQADQGAE